MAPDQQIQQQPSSFEVRGGPVRPWLALIALISGIFMSLQDTPMVTLALPTIQRSLNTDLSTVSWVLGAYHLGFAVLLITVGRFADQYGRKRVFLLSLVLFSF